MASVVLEASFEGPGHGGCPPQVRSLGDAPAEEDMELPGPLTNPGFWRRTACVASLSARQTGAQETAEFDLIRAGEHAHGLGEVPAIE